MDTTDYVAKLRKRLEAASLPARSRRLDELFSALLTCPPAEVDQVAALLTSVVETLVHPHRRKAMWAKLATLTGPEWRALAARRVVKSATRQRPRKLRPTKPIRKPHPKQLEATATAVLGVTTQAVQGAGHYQLELERLVLAGRCREGGPAWELLQRLHAGLRAADRGQRAAVLPLARLAGQVLAVVEEHPQRIAEIAGAFKGLSPDQLLLVARHHSEAREAEQRRIEEAITDLQLELLSADHVGKLAARLHGRRDLSRFWGKEERKMIRSIEVHLRQGEELRHQKQARDGSGSDVNRLAARTASFQMHHVAYRRASELIARLLTTQAAHKTPTWWERVAKVALREIEIDSLDAKRLKSSRQKELAAEALSAVARPSSERCMEEEIAAELGRSLGQLEYELSQNPGDGALKARIAQTRELRQHFLSKQKAKARAKLQELGESARQRASEGESLADSDWLFEME